MEHEELLRNARWEILREMSRGKSNATQLARGAKTSLPNVSQQLRLLEAYDLVEHTREQRRGAGKPRHLYRLKRPLCHLALARAGFAQKLFFSPDATQALLLSVLFLPSPVQAPLLKALLSNEELLEKCAIAHVKGGSESIELLLVTEHADEIRRKYSSVAVEWGGLSRTIISWTHTLAEVRDGLSRGDAHFAALLKAPHVLHDPKRIFERVVAT